MSESDYPRPVGEAPKRVPFAADVNWAIWSGIFGGIGILTHASHAIGFGHDYVSPSRRIGAIVLFSLSLVRLAGSVGMLVSRTWGFVLVFGASTLYGLNSAFALFRSQDPMLFIGVVANFWFAQYCISRLRGKRGTKPL